MGVGSGVCAWSAAVTKRHSPKMTKQRTGLGFLPLLSRETEWSTLDVLAYLRVSLCPSDAKSPQGLKRSDAKLHWRDPEWWRSSLLLMLSAINGLRSTVREKPGRRSDRTLYCLANRFPQKIKSLVACSQREVAIPMHRPHPWHHHAREAN